MILNLFFKLDNADEQAAAIRRELDGRMQLADSIMRERRFPKFKIDEDKSELEFNKSYIEELRGQVSRISYSRWCKIY